MLLIFSDIQFSEIYNTMSEDLFESSQNTGAGSDTGSSDNENIIHRFHLRPPQSLIEVYTFF